MKNLLFFLFCSLPALAQVHEVAEVSMVLPEELDEDIEVLVINEEELLLINLQEDFATKKDKNLSVIKLNSELKQQWVVYINIEKNKIPVNFRATDDKLYYLLQSPDTKKLELITVELSNGQWSIHSFESLTKLLNLNFDVFNGFLLISGEYSEKPVVEMHSLSINAAKVLPELHYKNTLLRGMFVNPYRNELYVITALSSKCQLNALIYDETGKLISKHVLGDKKHKLSNIQIRFSTDGEPFVVGTYNTVCNDLVAGLFSGSLDRPSKFHYNEISDLPSYTSTLSSKRQEKRQLRKEKGKESSARQRVLFSVPFSGENGYVASGEIYSQQTVNVPATNTIAPGGRRITLPSMYEYKVNKLLLAELGLDGKVNQDHLVKLEGKNFNSLRPQTAYFFKNDNFYGILPGKRDLNYVNMSVSNSPVRTYNLFYDSKHKINEIDVELQNWGSNAVLASGVAYLEFSNGQYSSVRQLYFIKKLEIKAE
jgi:hypothetical protein